jgi:NADH:ubiquinone oxidoreductase subunit 5 (subunit L)/multisubunit Na+/H+ antiporter MnhA subunit
MINWSILIILMVLTGFNVYYLFYFKQKSRKTGRVEETDNYYKLDAKIELQKYLAIGLISIAAWFGITKFSDISDKYQKFENLERNYNNLLNDYEEMKSYNKELKEAMTEMKELLIQFKLDNKNIEIEFLKQDQKIKEATRQIPEANIRMLTKQLIETNMRDVGTQGLWIDNPDTILINKELIKSVNMLKSAGYSPDEIEEIINDIKEKTPAFYKVN